MKLDNMQIATINMQELHDILANRDLTVIDPKTEERVFPSCFALEGEHATNPAIVAIANRLNDVLDELSALDGLFHDEFDDQFC